MIERVEQLRSKAEAEIAAAGSAEALQELRVRHLGRRAQLPQLLRGVAELPAEQRAAVGAAANQARHALEEMLERRAAELRSAELGSLLESDRVDSVESISEKRNSLNTFLPITLVDRARTVSVLLSVE